MRFLLRALLCLLPLVHGACLAWDEWVFLPVAPVAVTTGATVAPPLPLNHGAVATVLGLQGHGVPARSSEPLQLRASFVASSGASRALLAGAQGQRIYRGPGGWCSGVTDARSRWGWSRLGAGHCQCIRVRSRLACLRRLICGQ